MRSFLLLAVLFVGLSLPPAAHAAPASASDRKLARAYDRGQSEFFIRFAATVKASLPTDYDGIRHQKFIVELKTGQTLLIAHNIDLSSPVRRLRVGERIIIHGEYIWNDEGGLIHRTHDDTDGTLPDGWIRYKGKRYR
jgi:hypothetical protein